MSNANGYTEVFKRDDLVIRISKREYMGSELVDVRQFYRDAQNDDWKPSPKGVTFKPEQLAEVVATLKKLM